MKHKPPHNDDNDILDMVEEIMDMLASLDSPERAALVLLGCHASNYELNGKKHLTIDEYLDIYNEQFRGFFREMRQ